MTTTYCFCLGNKAILLVGLIFGGLGYFASCGTRSFIERSTSVTLSIPMYVGSILDGLNIQRPSTIAAKTLSMTTAVILVCGFLILKYRTDPQAGDGY